MAQTLISSRSIESAEIELASVGWQCASMTCRKTLVGNGGAIFEL
jgi:hypothetical protein